MFTTGNNNGGWLWRLSDERYCHWWVNFTNLWTKLCKTNIVHRPIKKSIEIPFFFLFVMQEWLTCNVYINFRYLLLLMLSHKKYFHWFQSCGENIPFLAPKTCFDFTKKHTKQWKYKIIFKIYHASHNGIKGPMTFCFNQT